MPICLINVYCKCRYKTISCREYSWDLLVKTQNISWCNFECTTQNSSNILYCKQLWIFYTSHRLDKTLLESACKKRSCEFHPWPNLCNRLLYARRNTSSSPHWAAACILTTKRLHPVLLAENFIQTCLVDALITSSDIKLFGILNQSPSVLTMMMTMMALVMVMVMVAVTMMVMVTMLESRWSGIEEEVPRVCWEEAQEESGDGTISISFW